MSSRRPPHYHKGDPVVYKTTKRTSRPGPRAQMIDPAPRGELYTYHVDKFWVVESIDDDGMVQLRTRRGKTHRLDANDARLRKAKWWERLIYRKRFPKLPAST